MKHLNRFSYLMFLPFFAFSCAKQSSNSSGSTSTTTAETIAKCATSTSYTNGVTITGTAGFYKRGLAVSNSGGYVQSISLSSVISTPFAIKYAEVKVLDSNSNIVQCGTTDASGNLKALDGTSSLIIPGTAGTYTVQVLARSFYTLSAPSKSTPPTLQIAVKTDIYSNEIYKVSTSITSSGYSSNPIIAGLSLDAEADENSSSAIEGGAFNIYNDWISIVEYLASSTNTGTYDISCLNTSLDVFWKKGFNPAKYIYPSYNESDLATLSFYLKSDQELYINGGVSGDVASSDTDHFDDTVIMHEMGHHLENVCGRMDSPGGQHTATNRIDPRLAWSEGWGNYIGAHMMKNNLSKINPNVSSLLPTAGEWLHYADTQGYNNGSSGVLVLFRLNRIGNNSGTAASKDSIDVVYPSTYPGEGHFREGSISRGLFKATNTCSSQCTASSGSASIPFSLVWRSISRSEGMGQSSKPFKSSDKFFDFYKQLNGGTMDSAVLSMLTTDEALQPLGHSDYNATVNSTSTTAWSGYAAELSTGTCSLSLQPRPMTYTLNSDESDQRYTNQFFAFTKSSSLTSISIQFSTGCNDVDLLVYDSSYSYNEDCTAYSSTTGLCSTRAKTTSDSVLASARTTSSSSDTVNLSALTNGNKYLLNVRAYSATPNSTFTTSSACTITLYNQSGAQLCPANSY